MRSTQRPSTDLSLQLESELDEELSRGREVVDHDADVVHSLDRHVLGDTRSRESPPPRPSDGSPSVGDRSGSLPSQPTLALWTIPKKSRNPWLSAWSSM
jgi:hypothetical protein